MVNLYRRWLLATALAASMLVPGVGAKADETIRVAASNQGLWDDTLFLWGAEAGIFKRHGLNIQTIWTDGGSEILQAVLTGTADIGSDIGLLSVMSAYEKRAPVALICSAMNGSSDLFWYVQASSTIKSFKDVGGRTVAFSRPGASTQLVAGALAQFSGVSPRFVQTGAAAATLVQVMTNQVEVGWAGFPFGMEQIEQGKLRMIATGNDAPGLSTETTRVTIASLPMTTTRKAALKAFIAATREVVEWAYTTDEALQKFADYNKITLDQARKARDEGYPRATVEPLPIQGLELALQQAVGAKLLSRPFTPEQIKDFTKYVPEFLAVP